MTRVALLWHMHQPYYEDLRTHEHILPWVRLHALKDYYGMAALVSEFPGLKVTFNLVPSLLVQLEAFAADRARDPYLDIGLKPAEALTDDDRLFIVRNFFHAQRQRMIDIYPRYAELLAIRGYPGSTREATVAAERFTVDDLRDLQVWHKLVWLDPYYLEGDDRVRSLVGKGQLFGEEDKQLLREVELELLNKVLPAYRAGAASGQIEISASPFYHPILPLLCDTDIYKRTHPESPMPRYRFAHPEDALEQLTRAAACHERLFGARPVGLWPSEGSVSDAIIPLVSQAGFRWLATDELVLARSLNTSFSRTAEGHLEQPERLYRPYVIDTGGARVACAFRDHLLSDLIGFSYAGRPAEAAADDFVSRLVEAGRRFAKRTGGEDALISVVLDGENAWEHFEGGGRPFLRALYGRLAKHAELRTVTMTEGCSGATDTLTSIFPGSWIDANFYIWIGHRDDQRAWDQLSEARAALDRPSNVSPEARAQAREEVLIAEGSDWCWWYGDDHSSEHDEEFDDLYRRHLGNVYRLLEKPVPDDLFVTNISTIVSAAAESGPTGLIHPTIDGEETSYFEWLHAGRLEIHDLPGAMHQTDRPRAIVCEIRFGFDRERLYVRVDAVRPMTEVLDDGYECSLKFLEPDGIRLSVTAGDGRLVATYWDRRGDPPSWHRRGPSGASVAAGTVLEVAVPIAELNPRAALRFVVALYDRAGSEVERHPASWPIEAAVAEALVEAAFWRA